MLDTDSNAESQPRFALAALKALSAISWIAGSLLLAYAFFVIQDIANMLIAMTDWYRSSREALRQALMLISGIAILSAIVLSGEYHNKYTGTSKSFWLIGIIVGIVFALWVARMTIILLN
jgi:hypothetical protein